MIQKNKNNPPKDRLLDDMHNLFAGKKEKLEAGSTA